MINYGTSDSGSCFFHQKDGIDSANQQAAAILADARKQADAIVAEAKSQADKLRDDAKAEIDVFKTSAQLSAQQAKRDAVLAFRQEIQKEFEKILAADVGKALDQQTLAKLIQAAVQGEDVSGYAVEVGQVTDGIRQQLAQELKTAWRSVPPGRWARASAWPPRTAPAILTAPTRRSRRCSCPSSGICTCKGVAPWLPITI